MVLSKELYRDTYHDWWAVRYEADEPALYYTWHLVSLTKTQELRALLEGKGLESCTKGGGFDWVWNLKDNESFTERHVE